ncbi:hypothetical protein [Pandoraea communis]|uniref:hypothetical protein n=1 Tax=Pandoraea communis TaxID=2508297 RepID=UPI0025A629EC|nr:hypothetical protein [Pandoraea communis]MDM8359275.1 hypothetical protein [Pandoraea communis]
MIATDSLRIIVLSGVSFCWPSPCRRACSAGANTSHWAPHFALSPAQPSNVQASCLERGWPAAIAAFAGALAAGAAAPPGRRCPERQRGAKAEGKIEGCGTTVRTKPVCTWVWGSTLPRAASCRPQLPCLAGIGNTGCRIRSGAMGLSGVAS